MENFSSYAKSYNSRREKQILTSIYIYLEACQFLALGGLHEKCPQTGKIAIFGSKFLNYAKIKEMTKRYKIDHYGIYLVAD